MRASSGMIGTIRCADAGIAGSGCAAGGRTRWWSTPAPSRRCRDEHGPAYGGRSRTGGSDLLAARPARGPRPSSAVRRRHHVLVARRSRCRGGSSGGSPSSSSASGIRELQAVAERLAAPPAVSFLIWWVALRGLELGPERPALDRLGQDDGRAALVLDRRLVGGVELAVVVPAAGQLAQVVVGEVLDHALRSRGSGPKKCSRM